MLSALAVSLCDNYLVIFRLALLFLITKLQRIFEAAIIYVGKTWLYLFTTEEIR